MIMYECSNQLGLVAEVVCVPAQFRASYDGTRWETR
jgi:hypothetical protein